MMLFKLHKLPKSSQNNKFSQRFYSTDQTATKTAEIPATPAATRRKKSGTPTGTGSDPTGWEVSEKLDGIRVYWNAKGELLKSLPEQTKINVPQSWLKGLPNAVTLEGELWCGYNTYNRAFDLSFKEGLNNIDAWKGAIFNVFDAPTRNDLKYFERIEEVKKFLPADHHSATLVKTITCKGKDHLHHLLHEVTRRGGEGLILREPNSFYNAKNTFLKVKARDDVEVLVKGHVNNTHLLCMHRSGTTFICPANSSILPPVNSVISVKYWGPTDFNTPRAVVSFRPRPDCTWYGICQKEIPYYVSYHRTSMPSCRGCGRQIEKTELRIKTTLMFVPPGCGPMPVQINFCMNFNCINQAIKKYNTQGTEIAPFDGRVWIHKDVKKDALPSIPGFYWTFIDPAQKTIQSTESPEKVLV